MIGEGGETRVVFGRDPVADEVEGVLLALESGAGRDSIRETVRVDLKEEPERRDRRGVLQPATARSDRAADALAGEAACMANSDGGGALIVGVGDDGSLIGTALDAEWLRSRIYDLTERKLTVDVHPAEIGGVRLLVIRAPQALEPIRWRGHLTWRVDDRCVEMDATTWHSRRMTRERFDWSEQSSYADPHDARPAALEIARRHLRASGEAPAAQLANAPDQEMLRRLNAVDGEGYLTNAGALVFVGRGDPALDYIRRTVPAGDSRRWELLEPPDHQTPTDVPLFVEGVHRGLDGIDLLQERQTSFTDPTAAVREALVNGVV